MANIQLPSDHCLFINYNEHKLYYEDLDPDDVDDWVSEEERQKAIDTDSVWQVSWYPNTPVGFYSATASSFSAAVAGVRADEWAEKKAITKLEEMRNE